MSARILVVDDEEIVIRSCLRILGESDYEVESAQDGWEALKKIEDALKGSPEDASLRMVTSYWDMVGALVNNGILHAGLLFETTGEAIQVWNKVKGWVEGIRKETRPTYLRNLELLATRHLEWRQGHATSLPHEQAKTPLRGVSGGDS